MAEGQAVRYRVAVLPLWTTLERWVCRQRAEQHHVAVRKCEIDDPAPRLPCPRRVSTLVFYGVASRVKLV